jgi:hypothetical protein
LASVGDSVSSLISDKAHDTLEPLGGALANVIVIFPATMPVRVAAAKDGAVVTPSARAKPIAPQESFRPIMMIPPSNFGIIEFRKTAPVSHRAGDNRKSKASQSRREL